MKGNIFRVKTGKTNTWKRWCADLQGKYLEEACNSLHDEGVSQEGFFFFTIDETDYVLGYIEGEGLPADMSKEINMLHKKYKSECLERIGGAESLYHITNPSNKKTGPKISDL